MLAFLLCAALSVVSGDQANDVHYAMDCAQREAGSRVSMLGEQQSASTSTDGALSPGVIEARTADSEITDSEESSDRHVFVYRPSSEPEPKAPVAEDADEAEEDLSAVEAPAMEAPPVDQPPPPVALVVHTDYKQAMKEAAEDRKMLLIYFYETRTNAARRAFETQTLADLEIQEKLNRYVVVKLPRNARITANGRTTLLLDHPAFAEMLGRPGVAIVDLVHERAEYYGHVVSTFPFSPGRYYRKYAFSIILDLPPGTLTQRTMIYAVRVHPERPASTQGVFHNVLAEEAKLHAKYQAKVLSQGHQSWETRFHRINSRLPGGVMAREIVAESWPGQTLVDACVDCVDSWRQSPGHWSAVRSRHPVFGYDIKRGRNGIWYATGIFGQR